MSDKTNANIRPIGKSIEGVFNGSSREVEKALDRLMTALPIGQVSSAIGDSFYGLNHRQQPGALPINKDFHGLAFFTRPRLNLTTENIRAVRLMTPLLTSEPASLQRIIRCLLSPDLARLDIGSPFVDRQQAFIPVLTNNLISMAGWPDLEAPQFTSQQGVYKEAFSIVDGLVVNYTTYDITANFRNLPGDPISALFLIWLHYMSNVFVGSMVPFPDMIVQNEIDYNTRIYRLILDATKTRVTAIAACGAAFPWSVPYGAKFNFDAQAPVNRWDEQITINFRCMGVMYQDDILIDEFNSTVAMFNDQMEQKNFSAQRARVAGGSYDIRWSNRYLMQVPMDALGVFNNRGYPRIDPDTYELQWWVSKEDYQARLPSLSDYREQRTF